MSLVGQFVSITPLTFVSIIATIFQIVKLVKIQCIVKGNQATSFYCKKSGPKGRDKEKCRRYESTGVMEYGSVGVKNKVKGVRL